jgi:hypothetical protein
MTKKNFLVLYIGISEPNLGMLLHGIMDLVPAKVEPEFHCVETINLGLQLLYEDDSYDLIMTHQDDNKMSNGGSKYCCVEELIEHQSSTHSAVPIIVMADRVMGGTAALNNKKFKIYIISKDNTSAISDAITASAWTLLSNVPRSQAEQSIH